MQMSWRRVSIRGLIRLVLIHNLLLIVIILAYTIVNMYIGQVAPTLVPLLKFYFHEEVRKAAVSGLTADPFYN